MAQGLAARSGVIDGAISISAVQVSISDRHPPRKKLKVIKELVVDLKKKDQHRKKGNTVPPDSRYTGWKRKARF